MFIAAVIVSIVLAVLMVLSAVGKLRGDEMQLATMRRVGFPRERVWLLAMAELAGGVGLIVGLIWWSPLGVAAATGLVLYFVGAVIAHLRARDWNVSVPGVILLIAVATLVLQL